MSLQRETDRAASIVRMMRDADPLENKTESFTLEAPTTRYTVHVTLEADVPTVPKTFDTWREAEAHSQFVTMLLSGTAEPQPAYVTHDAVGSAYTTSGQHELYGEWSVTLTVRETH